VTGLARSSDGERLFGLGEGGLVVLDAESGRLIATLSKASDFFRSLAASPVAPLVVTASAEDVEFWDARPWKR
jgi:hypothetical protein